jgi:hypothetical protein
MSRFSMALTAAAASAIVAAAVVALPAFGGDSGSAGPPTKPAPDFSALVACLNAHGLTGAPAAPEQFKQWLGAKEASDPQATRAAEKACQGEVSEPAGSRGPDAKDFGACLRGRGVDAPTDPDALKRWLADKSSDSSYDDDFRACKLQLDPGKPGADEKNTPACGAPDTPPADTAPAEKPPADTGSARST